MGADVEATNVEHERSATTKTNGTGEYQIDNLLPGTYHVTVRAQGSSRLRKRREVMNKTGTLNVTVTPGATTETVEVSGAPPIIDTTTAQLQSTYEQSLKVDSRRLPLVGLGVINLSLLQAGVGSSGGLGAGTGPQSADSVRAITTLRSRASTITTRA